MLEWHVLVHRYTLEPTSQPIPIYILIESMKQPTPTQTMHSISYWIHNLYIAAFIRLLLLLLLAVPSLSPPSTIQIINKSSSNNNTRWSSTTVCTLHYTPHTYVHCHGYYCYIFLHMVNQCEWECVVWHECVGLCILCTRIWCFFMLVSRPINFPVVESNNWRLSHFTLSRRISLFVSFFSAIFFCWFHKLNFQLNQPTALNQRKKKWNAISSCNIKSKWLLTLWTLTHPLMGFNVFGF